MAGSDDDRGGLMCADFPVSAAVLTGGLSRRMGTDKALLRVNGTTLLERTLRVLQLISSDVFIVGDRPAYHDFGVPVRPDDAVGAGTLGGIATALRHARHARVVVVACDMPLLSSRLLRRLAEQAVALDADVVVPVRSVPNQKQGRSQAYEPLHAVYATRCLPAIEQQLALGDLRVFAFLDAVKLSTCDEPWLRQYDPDLSSTTNANTPDEFDRVIAALGSAHDSEE